MDGPRKLAYGYSMGIALLRSLHAMKQLDPLPVPAPGPTAGDKIGVPWQDNHAGKNIGKQP